MATRKVSHAVNSAALARSAVEPSEVVPEIDREIARATRARARARAAIAASVPLAMPPTVLQVVVLKPLVKGASEPDAKFLARVFDVEPLAPPAVVVPAVPIRKGPRPESVQEGHALLRALDARPSGAREHDAHVLEWARATVLEGAAACWAAHGHARAWLRSELSRAAWASATPAEPAPEAKGRPVDRAGFSGGAAGLRGRVAPTVAIVQGKKRVIRHAAMPEALSDAWRPVGSYIAADANLRGTP